MFKLTAAACRGAPATVLPGSRLVETVQFRPGPVLRLRGAAVTAMIKGLPF